MNAKLFSRTDDGTTVTLVVSGVAFTGSGKEYRERQARLDAIKQAHIAKRSLQCAKPMPVKLLA